MPGVNTLLHRAVERYRSDGLASTAAASARHVLRSLLQRLEGNEEHATRQLTSVDFTSYKHLTKGKEQTVYDVILATDLRFPGGSSASSAQEIEIQSSAGLETGVYHLDSEKMSYRSAIAPTMERALGMKGVNLLNLATRPTKTRLLLFRHPAILNPNRDDPPKIETDEVALIINHPPVKFGKIEYLLTDAIRRLREQYGCEPKIYPIGPLVRNAVNHFYDGKVELADSDWINVFDLERFRTTRSAPQSRPLRIGRHSRPNKEKWPERAEDIALCYPESGEVEVHVLGGADVPKSILGRIPKNWRVHDFGQMDPAVFLKNIDVFVYFHHSEWVEAFGRVIVEAMASGLPVILPRHFEPLVGAAGIYCGPEDVSKALEALRDPEYYMQRSNLSCATANERFGAQVHLQRLRKLGVSVAGREAGE